MVCYNTLNKPMKKYIPDFICGLIISFFFLVLPTYFVGGVIGADSLSKLFPTISNEFIIILVYILFGLIPFSIYASTSFYKKKHHTINLKTLLFSFFFFSLGLILLFILVIVISLMLFDFSPSIS